MKDNAAVNVRRGGTLSKSKHLDKGFDRKGTVEDIDHRGRELSNCNFVKVILMLLVVLYHSILLWGGSWFNQAPVYSSSILKWIARWLDSFHIYGFTLVSGYIFYFLKHEQGKYDAFLPFLKNKAKRLLVPYVFVAAVWVIPIQWYYFKFDWQTIIEKYLLGTGPNQLWFLLMLFHVFVVFWLLADFFAKHDFWGMVLAGAFWAVGVCGGILLPNVFVIWTAFQYVPLFWLGFKLRQHGTAMARRIPVMIYFLCHALLFAVAQILGSYDAALMKMAHIAASFVTNVVGALMVFVILQKIADRVNWDNGFFRFLSKRSMIVYLFHQQVIYFFIDWLNGALNPYLHGAVNFIGAMTVSLLIAAVLLSCKATRFLIGEK